MKKKKLISIIIIVALAGAALWFFVLRRNKIGGSTSDLDQQQYDKLYNYLLENIKPEAVKGWLGDKARELYTSGNYDSYYKVDGMNNKTGALMAAYASSYYGYGYEHKRPEEDVKQGAYSIFDVLKYTQSNKL